MFAVKKFVLICFVCSVTDGFEKKMMWLKDLTCCVASLSAWPVAVGCSISYNIINMYTVKCKKRNRPMINFVRIIIIHSW